MTKRTISRRRRQLYAAIAAFVVLVVGGAYASYRLGLRPIQASGDMREFTVKSGDSAPGIGQRLVDEGLLRDRNAFVTYINLHGLRAHLKAGTYLIAPTMSGEDIAELLAGGRTTAKRLLVPEGYTLSQIETAAGKLGLTKASFEAALAAPHNQAFLATKPAGVSLEGYLFPDSYDVESTTTAAALVERMLDTFGSRVGTEYTQAFAAQGLNLHQALTLASIVEREVSIPADRPVVAQIFLKRFRSSMALGSDVTTEYAAKLMNTPFDLNLNSPYNTRRFAGLPPGPICNPGLGSLDAVAHPATTDYLFFLTGKDGKTYFGKTYAEHQANIDRHL